MLKSLAGLALAAVSLCACSGAGDLDGNLDIGGMEPAYWTVEINREEAKSTISILGEPSFDGSLPVKSQGEDGSTLLTSKTDQGDFVMVLTHKDCFDGLAEGARPWSVSVKWKGETLVGCAVPKA